MDASAMIKLKEERAEGMQCAGYKWDKIYAHNFVGKYWETKFLDYFGLFATLFPPPAPQQPQFSQCSATPPFSRWIWCFVVIFLCVLVLSFATPPSQLSFFLPFVSHIFCVPECGHTIYSMNSLGRLRATQGPHCCMSTFYRTQNSWWSWDIWRKLLLVMNMISC